MEVGAERVVDLGDEEDRGQVSRIGIRCCGPSLDPGWSRRCQGEKMLLGFKWKWGLCIGMPLLIGEACLSSELPSRF